MYLGRATFESTTKAVVADFFPLDAEAAFANVVVQSGGATAVAFFVFPYLSGASMAYVSNPTNPNISTNVLFFNCVLLTLTIQTRYVCAAMAALAVPCLVVAFRRHSNQLHCL